MTRVLVIGAAGYVGQRVMLAFKGRPDAQAIGADVRTLAGVADHRIDMAFPAQSFGLIAETKPDVVLNLAYILSAGIEAAPQRGIETNIVGVNGLFEACWRLGVPRVVYASSGSVYGDQSVYGDRDVDEEEPLPPPRTLYQLHKQFNEAMARHYNRTTRTRFIGLRISSPHGRGKTSSDFSPFDQLVQAAAAGRTTHTLNCAADRPLSFNHVDDVAAACVLMTLAPSLGHDLYNLGGEPLTAGDLAKMAAERTGLQVSYGKPSSPAIFMRRISAKRLETELGFHRSTAAEWFGRELAEAKAVTRAS